MNANLTIDTLSFNQAFSDEPGSLRREISRGVNIPTELKIAHTEYIDGKTKRPYRRSIVRFDRYVALADGTIAPVSRYEVVSYPVDANVTGTDIQAVVQHGVSINQEDDSGLDLMVAIFNNREQ